MALPSSPDCTLRGAARAGWRRASGLAQALPAACAAWPTARLPAARRGGPAAGTRWPGCCSPQRGFAGERGFAHLVVLLSRPFVAVRVTAHGPEVGEHALGHVRRRLPAVVRRRVALPTRGRRRWGRLGGARARAESARLPADQVLGDAAVAPLAEDILRERASRGLIWAEGAEPEPLSSLWSGPARRRHRPPPLPAALAALRATWRGERGRTRPPRTWR